MITATRRAVLLTGLAAPFAAHAAPGASDVLTKAMEGTSTPGMAALVLRNFKAEPELVAGIRRMGRPAPVRPGDRWHLGSNGKAMTATLIARLVERGVLAWDRPLDQMLPGLAATMRPEYRDVTLPDLLSHRAGLPENHDDTAFFNGFYADAAPLPAQRLRYLTTALADAPAGPKRGEMIYSNTGLLTAAAVAEHATGKPFETLIVQEVFKPLGMGSISFDQFGGTNEPCGHVDGRPADKVTDANPRMFAPAGAMRLTLADWGRFCIDHMRGEHGQGKLLKADTYRFLHTGQGETRSALGWGASPRPMGLTGPALTHAGSDGNWYALVVLFPQTGSGALVIANAADSMGGDKAAMAATRALAATVAAPAPTAP